MSRASALWFSAAFVLLVAAPAWPQEEPSAAAGGDVEAGSEDGGEEPQGDATPAPTRPKVDTTGMEIQDKILAESFPGFFEPIREEKPYFWSVDLNGDEVDDLVIMARSKAKVLNAWKKMPLHNPPYEWASRGEIQENPMFEAHYEIRAGERYLIVYHGGPKGWKQLSVSSAFVLQDVAESTPELTTFGEEEEQANGLKFRYEGKPGLLYWAGDRYVAAMKDQ